MIKSIKAYWILLCVGLFTLIVMYVFSQQRFLSSEVSEIKIKLAGGSSSFVSQKRLINLLKANVNNPAKIFVNAVNINKLEELIKLNVMVEDADVFFASDGTLIAQVKQRNPIARVIDDNKNYYIDDKGLDMPLSLDFSARVPLVYGLKRNSDKEKVYELLMIINKDDFLKNSITSITLKENQQVNLMTRDFNFVINFGRLEEINQKIKNYKAFAHYLDGTQYRDVYKKINLNFTQQVICSKG